MQHEYPFGPCLDAPCAAGARAAAGAAFLKTTPFAVWVAIALAVFMPVAFYPFSRTLWLAWDLSFRPIEPGDGLRKL